MTLAREILRPNVVIYVESDKLSDGSEVWNVVMGNIFLRAVTEDDAIDLAQKLHDAIEAHTNDQAAIAYE